MIARETERHERIPPNVRVPEQKLWYESNFLQVTVRKKYEDRCDNFKQISISDLLWNRKLQGT